MSTFFPEPEEEESNQGVPTELEVYNRIMKAADTLETIGKKLEAKVMRFAIEQYLNTRIVDPANGGFKRNDLFLSAIEECNQIPVTIEEFLSNPEFLGNPDFDIWDPIKTQIIKMKQHPFLTDKPITEIYNGGAISTSKSTVGIIGMLYDIYCLCCFNRPYKLFGLLPSKSIMFSLQSAKIDTAYQTLFKPLRSMFQSIPWFQKNVDYNPKLEHQIIIKNKNIEIFYGSTKNESTVGQDILGSIVDECNFLEVINESKKSQGAVYDQAEYVVNKLLSRRISRFPNRGGPSIGCNYICSSANYVDDFLDRRIKAINPEKDHHIYSVILRQFDMKPASNYPSGIKFKFLLGNESYAGKILNDDAVEGVDYPENGIVHEVPIELESEFRRDPDTAQLDILGVASSAVSRFIGNPVKIDDAVKRFQIRGNKVYVNEQNCILAIHGLPNIIVQNIPTDKNAERFIHVDLSRTKDRCGIAICKIPEFVTREKEENGIKFSEQLPFYEIELAVSIQPSGHFELQISDIRKWIETLKTIYGLNIRGVSYDGLESAESRELLKQAGIYSAYYSLDRSTEGYDNFKDALYDGRISLPPNDLLCEEITRLRKVCRGSVTKIDHPSSGNNPSKDIADAVAGAMMLASSFKSNFNKSKFDTEGSKYGRRNPERRSYKEHRSRKRERR